VTKTMGNYPDGLIMSHAWYVAAIHDLEDASFGLHRGVGTLIEQSAHLAVTLRRAVAVVHSRALVVARACAYPRRQLLGRIKGAAVGPTSAMICCAESTPSRVPPPAASQHPHGGGADSRPPDPVGHLLLEECQFLQGHLQQPPVNRVELAAGAQRVAQLRRRGSQALIRHGG